MKNKNEMQIKTFIQVMKATIQFYESTYKTAYTKEGMSRFPLSPRFVLMVERCTNWAIQAELIDKKEAFFNETKPVEVQKQYHKLVMLYKKVI